ncbi:MAG: DUF58 domain-containing protein [Polyangiaceae bacterium]|nr:DUF58 domain-containing protein [Polyangiaceae bacterium]
MRVDQASLSRYMELRLHAAGHATSQVQGNRRSAEKGRGVEFAEYRAYDPGDDIRLVDWNVYLRLGVALVKQFTEERSLSLRVCVDTSESMAFGEPRKADQAAQIAAAVAMVALGQREPVTLVCAGGEGPVMRAKAVNPGQMGELVAVLERAEPRGRASLKDQLAAHLGSGRSDLLVLISDLLLEDEELASLLRLCAASSHRTCVVHVLGPDELDPPLDSIQRVVDAETQEEIVLPASAKKAYQEALASWRKATEERCRKLGLTYVFAPTELGLEQVMHRALPGGRVVEHRIGGLR